LSASIFILTALVQCPYIKESVTFEVIQGRTQGVWIEVGRILN